MNRQTNEIYLNQESATTSLTVRLGGDGRWNGRLRMHASRVVEDQGFGADWEIPVSLEQVQLAPALIPVARGAFDPIRLRLSQPVACDSLEVDIVDSMGRRPAYTVNSNCEPSNASDYPSGYTSDVSLVPATYWSEMHYRVRVGTLRGLSNVSSDQSQESPVRLMPFISQGPAFDFEEGDASSWTEEFGRPNCSVVSSVSSSDGSAIQPSSGAKMLSCAPATFGYSSVVGQLRVPAGATTMSIMVGSKHSEAEVSFLLEQWELRFSNGNKLSPAKEAVVQSPDTSPAQWTGWHRIEMPIPPGVDLAELKIGMFGCLTLETPNQCMISSHLLLDGVSFQ